jgi:tetratricopeptide (TPR) repeat protein
MRALKPPNSHHLSAATGWLELGDCAEARQEWERLTVAARRHPDALEVRWRIYAEEKDWDGGLATARALMLADPNRASGWLHQAYALRRVNGGGVKAALDALLPAADKFPDEPVIPYNIACYTCQLQQFDLARIWLRRALRAGEPARIKETALSDSDLEPLWDEIAAL